MLHALPIRLLLVTVGVALLGSGSVRVDEVVGDSAGWTEEQTALIDFAVDRFEAQGLDLPQLEFVFHDSLVPCGGHKGGYNGDRGVIEMCSNDKATLLHEMAHAWARANLTTADRESFVAMHRLDSWNDHDHAWDRRGTEHVAETIAWALMDDPPHVSWVETLPDGTKNVGHRILTIDVDVETLVENFRIVTGMSPVFRDPGEWAVEDQSPETSPEARRGA